MTRYNEYRLLIQLHFGQYFVIEFKVDKAFHYEGLEKAIYEAVSSNGINIISQSLRSIMKFKIPLKEFSVASVQFLILELLIFVITTVRKSQDYQTAKSSSYF